MTNIPGERAEKRSSAIPVSSIFERPHDLASSRIPASVVLGLVLYALIIVILAVLHGAGVTNWMFTFVYDRLFLRGSIPHFMTVGFTIGLALLLIRLPLLQRENRRLNQLEKHLASVTVLDEQAVGSIPPDHNKRNTLSDSVFSQIVHRSVTADSRAEMDGMVDQIMSIERRKIDASHVPVRYLIWLIPTLGFLGTVLGISLAVSGFSEVITKSSGQTDINSNLIEICQELGVAFDTTFVALIYSSIIALLMAYIDRRELSLLNTLDEFYSLSIRPRLAISTKAIPVTALSAESGFAAEPASAAQGPGAVIMLQSPNDEKPNVSLHEVAEQIVNQALVSLAKQGNEISHALAEAGTSGQLRQFIDANLIHMREQIAWMKSSAITRQDLAQLSDTFAQQAVRLQELAEADAKRQAETRDVLEKLVQVADKLHAEGVAAKITINSLVSAPGNA